VVEDPVTATHEISCDLSVKKPVIHLAGRSACSALDLMEFFHGKMQAFLPRCEGACREEFSDIVDKCGFVLSSFKEDKHKDLAQYLDWPAKFVICENRALKKKIAWDHHDIRMTDFQYHYLNPKRDLFSSYKKIMGMQDIVSEQEIAEALSVPPLTRAFIRGTFLKYLSKGVTEMDWTMVAIRGKAIGDNRKIFSETVYRLPDPAYPSTAEEAVLEESRIKSFAAALGQ
jgi:proteasome accessory factor A